MSVVKLHFFFFFFSLYISFISGFIKWPSKFYFLFGFWGTNLSVLWLKWTPNMYNIKKWWLLIRFHQLISFDLCFVSRIRLCILKCAIYWITLGIAYWKSEVVRDRYLYFFGFFALRTISYSFLIEQVHFYVSIYFSQINCRYEFD